MVSTFANKASLTILNSQRITRMVMIYNYIRYYLSGWTWWRQSTSTWSRNYCSSWKCQNQWISGVRICPWWPALCRGCHWARPSRRDRPCPPSSRPSASSILSRAQTGDLQLANMWKTYALKSFLYSRSIQGILTFTCCLMCRFIIFIVDWKCILWSLCRLRLN